MGLYNFKQLVALYSLTEKILGLVFWSIWFKITLDVGCNIFRMYNHEYSKSRVC